jgi:twitching motility protein PilT
VWLDGTKDRKTMGYKLEEFTRILNAAAQAEANEICFKVPNRPLFRIDGALVPTNESPLTPGDTQELALTIARLARIELPIASLYQREFSFGVHGIGRFRASVFRQRGTLALVVQLIRLNPPSLTDLDLDPHVETLVGRRGLFLLAGAKRKEALAALINGYNGLNRGHVVVLERSLSYLYRDGMASISHREVGHDVEDYASGIKQATSMGTDVLAVVDIENPSTIDSVLMAAESEIPVIVTVSAPDADSAVWWLTRRFYGQHREDIEVRITSLLHTIIGLSRDGENEVHSVYVEEG